MKTVILFNGPPSSGKDTLGRALARNLQLPVLQFKDALYVLTADHYSVDLEWLVNRNEAGEASKTLPRAELPNNISVRQALIHVSENVIKPHHGNNYFGEQAANVIQSLPTAKGYVFTDSGFYEELAEVAKVVRRVVLFRIRRKYCTFEGDSRQYLVDESKLPANCVAFDITNNSTIDEALWTILEHLCLGVNVSDERDLML